MNAKLTVYDALFQPTNRTLEAPCEASLGWNEFLLSCCFAVFNDEGKLLLLSSKEGWDLPFCYASTKEDVPAAVSAYLGHLLPSFVSPNADYIRTLTCPSAYRLFYKVHTAFAPSLPEGDVRFVSEDEWEALRADGLLTPLARLAFSVCKWKALNFKTICRCGWPRVLSRSFVCEYLPADKASNRPAGAVSLLQVSRVTGPSIKFTGGKPYTITDSGYFWFQFAPNGDNIWLTAMFDPDLNLVQYYFDITYRNEIFSDGSACFFDLYLDLVLLPNGERYILDEDELLDAERAGHITPEMTAFAFSRLEKLELELDGRDELLLRWVLGEVRRLRPKLS